MREQRRTDAAEIVKLPSEEFSEIGRVDGRVSLDGVGPPD